MNNLDYILNKVNNIPNNDNLIVKGAIKDINRNIRIFSYATEKTQILLRKNILKSVIYLVIHIKDYNIKKSLFQYVIDNIGTNKTSNWYKNNLYYKGIIFSYKKEKIFKSSLIYINDVPFTKIKDYQQAKKKVSNFLLDMSI